MSFESKRIIQKKVISSIEKKFFDFQNEKYGLLNEYYTNLTCEEKQVYSYYSARNLQKFFKGCDFARRAIEKPFGYAGDYLQVLDIFREKDLSSLKLFDQIITKYVMMLDPSIAHRNRIDYLVDMLKKLSSEKNDKKENFTFASIGCGPAVEIERFVKLKNTVVCDGLLIDMDERAINYCKSNLDKNLRNDFTLNYEVRSVRDFIRPNFMKRKFDLIYCAGFFDYLSDNFCQKINKNLFEHLTPGGILIFTNVAHNRHYYLIESLSEWFINIRDEDDMKGLCNFIDKDHVIIKKDPSGVNLFAEIKKDA